MDVIEKLIADILHMTALLTSIADGIRKGETDDPLSGIPNRCRKILACLRALPREKQEDIVARLHEHDGRLAESLKDIIETIRINIEWPFDHRTAFQSITPDPYYDIGEERIVIRLTLRRFEGDPVHGDYELQDVMSMGNMMLSCVLDCLRKLHDVENLPLLLGRHFDNNLSHAASTLDEIRDLAARYRRESGDDEAESDAVDRDGDEAESDAVDRDGDEAPRRDAVDDDGDE